MIDTLHARLARCCCGPVVVVALVFFLRGQAVIDMLHARLARRRAWKAAAATALESKPTLVHVAQVLLLLL